MLLLELLMLTNRSVCKLCVKYFISKTSLWYQFILFQTRLLSVMIYSRECKKEIYVQVVLRDNWKEHQIKSCRRCLLRKDLNIFTCLYKVVECMVCEWVFVLFSKNLQLSDFTFPMPNWMHSVCCRIVSILVIFL